MQGLLSIGNLPSAGETVKRPRRASGTSTRLNASARAPVPILFQFGDRDFYIAPMSGREFHRAAPEGSDLLTYETGHDMRLAEIRADQRAFLARNLGFDGSEAPPHA